MIVVKPVKLVKKEQRDQKVQRVILGATGKTGAPGASGNSNSHLEWVGVNILQDATGQALRKSGGNASWANGYAYTNYVLTGGCSVSFKPTATNNSFMVGLTTTTSRNTTTARYANIDYAFYPHSGGKVRIYEAGARKTDDITTYTPVIYLQLHTIMLMFIITLMDHLNEVFLSEVEKDFLLI